MLIYPIRRKNYRNTKWRKYESKKYICSHSRKQNGHHACRQTCTEHVSANDDLHVGAGIVQHCRQCFCCHAIRKCSDCGFHGLSAADSSDRGRCRYRCRYERTTFQIPWRKKFRKSQSYSQQRSFPVWFKLPGFPGPWSYSCKTILRQPGT